MRSVVLALTGLMPFALAASDLIHRQPDSPSRSDEFTLAMSVNGTYVALSAVSNGTEDMVLMAQLVGHSPGTPSTGLSLTDPAHEPPSPPAETVDERRRNMKR